MKGCGTKSSLYPSKSRENKVFGGIWAGILAGVLKKVERMFVFNSWPLPKTISFLPFWCYGFVDVFLAGSPVGLFQYCVYVFLQGFEGFAT